MAFKYHMHEGVDVYTNTINIRMHMRAYIHGYTHTHTHTHTRSARVISDRRCTYIHIYTHREREIIFFITLENKVRHL
jgi:hypothetical protein